MGSDDFLEFCKTGSLGGDGDDITYKCRCIGLDRSIWFMLGRLMWKKHCYVFDENIYYVRNDIQKYFKMSILKYAGKFWPGG